MNRLTSCAGILWRTLSTGFCGLFRNRRFGLRLIFYSGQKIHCAVHLSSGAEDVLECQPAPIWSQSFKIALEQFTCRENHAKGRLKFVGEPRDRFLLRVISNDIGRFAGFHLVLPSLLPHPLPCDPITATAKASQL